MAVTSNRYRNPDFEITVFLVKQSTSVCGDQYAGKVPHERFGILKIEIPQCIARGGDGYLPFKFAADCIQLSLYTNDQRLPAHTVCYKHRVKKQRTDNYKPKKIKKSNMLRYSTTRAIGAASESGWFEIPATHQEAEQTYYILYTLVPPHSV